MKPEIKALMANGGQVNQIDPEYWRLSIPKGPAGKYRLAQLDDYANRQRKSFPWVPPLLISLKMRASAANLPGTWGFGLWNDPFSFSLGFKGASRRLPALPNAAWFFFASKDSYLSLRNDLPFSGQLAGSFLSPKIPGALLMPTAVAFPLLFIPPIARAFRKVGRKIIKEDAINLNLDPREWQEYAIRWERKRIIYSVNQEPVLESKVVPSSPLGLVIWIDNQFAAYRPDGKISFGTQKNPESWIEIKDLKVEPL